MKKLSRIFSCLLILIMVLATLTACGNQGGQNNDTPLSVPSAPVPTATNATGGYNNEPVEIEIWVGPSWQGVYDPLAEGADYGDFWNYTAQEFQKKYPNFKFSVETVASRDRDERLAVGLQAGTLPNCLFDSAFGILDYLHQGALVPLNDVISQDTYNDIDQAIWDAVSVNNNIYCYPFSAETGHLAVNMSILKQAGAADMLRTDETGMIVWTPEELRSVLEKIRDANLPGVVPMGFYAGSSSGDTFTNLLLRMFGADFLNADQTEVTLNSEKGVKALQFLLDMKNDGLLTPGAESATWNDVRDMFANGQVGVCQYTNLDYSRLLTSWQDGTVNKFDFNWAYFPSESKPFNYCYVRGTIVFNTKDDNEIAATKAYVDFYSNAPYTKASTILAPIRKSIISTATFNDPMVKEIADAMGNAVVFSFPNIPGYVQIRSAFFPQIQAALTGKKTAQQALDDFKADADKIIQTNRASSVVLK